MTIETGSDGDHVRVALADVLAGPVETELDESADVEAGVVARRNTQVNEPDTALGNFRQLSVIVALLLAMQDRSGALELNRPIGPKGYLSGRSSATRNRRHW
jgi:hypothetical protein